MNVDPKIANDIAMRYFATDKPLIRLGWGISGFVYLSPDTRTAVKVHRHAESFERELYVYRKLARLKINRLHGLTIPKLRDNRADVKLLCLDFVCSPYLLDFAGVGLSPPDFTDDAMAQWMAGIDEMFGPNASIPHMVYHSLKQHSVYIHGLSTE